MLAYVAIPGLHAIAGARASIASRKLAVQLPRVLIDVPASPHAQNLHIGFDRLERSQQRKKPAPLGVPGEPLI